MPTSIRRQLDHYVEWTEYADAGIKSPDELHWHQWFTSEWPNVRNVFRWACTVDDGDAACRLVSATLWWATSRMQLEADRWCELALGLPSAADHALRPAVLAGASLFAHTRGDHDHDRRSLERARAEERRLGVGASTLVEAAALNLWDGGPAAAMRDVAASRLRAEDASDQLWQLTAGRGEARILATLTRGAAPSPDDDATSIARIRQIVEQAETYGQPSGVADTRASLGIASRSSEPAAALALLEDSLDLCASLGDEEISNVARCQLASHYTQLERPRDALTLMRTTIPGQVRVGAWHEVYGALAHTAQAFVDVGRPRVAATILGRLSTGTSEFDRNYHGFPALRDQLVAALDAADLAILVNESQSQTLADIAQLVIQTIDGL